MEHLIKARNSILSLFDALDTKIESADVDTLIAIAEAENKLTSQLVRLEYAISQKVNLEDIITSN